MERIANALSARVGVKYIAIAILALKVLLIGVLAYRIFASIHSFQWGVDNLFFYYIGVGFLAQLVDGALGMAYGATCTSMLLGVGVPPAYATASVHTAEVFTTGVSGLSHLYFGNIDKKLFFRIVITGVIGSMIGAYLISEVIDGKVIRPYISLYLVGLGIIIIVKAFKKRPTTPTNKNLGILGLIGGFFDSIGGGGWGPLVTSNLINKGNAPKEAIGTVNTAEFFVAFFSTGIFMLFIDIQAWQPIAGLILGGVLAAPLGAFLVRLFPPKTIMLIVGTLVVGLSIYNIIKVWF
jgi:uncharacterized membrane protein YfcA